MVPDAKPPVPVALSDEERERYARHLVLPEVGIEGQKRLKAARVLVVGVGGLGSPVALYLAAAGVGRLGLVDADPVDRSNLQRQILYTTSDIGGSKVHAAATRLRSANPNVKIVPHEKKLTSANAMEIIRDYDLVVDCSDNFPTRYLVNDACVLSGRRVVFASLYRFEGQVSVFGDAAGPCYRCFVPNPPPPDQVPTCEVGGVIGALPGLVGSLQASEAIKLLLGVGQPLIGRLLLVDALDVNVMTVKLPKNESCVACGKTPTLKALIDYEQFCGPKAVANARADATAVTVVDLKRMMDAKEDFVLVDVRNPPEAEIARIEGSRLIPMRDLAARLTELDPKKEIVVHCHTGVRSNMAAGFLRKNGFTRVYNLTGGIEAWSREVDPFVPRY